MLLYVLIFSLYVAGNGQGKNMDATFKFLHVLIWEKDFATLWHSAHSDSPSETVNAAIGRFGGKEYCENIANVSCSLMIVEQTH